jgi:orotidine-5'-phosphate decarboxylase
MCTLHISGGEQMLKRAVAAASQSAEINRVIRPLLVGITVLTSEQKQGSICELVLQKANLAKMCKLDGVVASAQEAPLIRQKLGDKFIIVTPGIRPKGSSPHDQQRITTPAQAIQNGCDFLVVGRPIIEADDPLDATKAILREIQETNNL